MKNKWHSELKSNEYTLSLSLKYILIINETFCCFNYMSLNKQCIHAIFHRHTKLSHLLTSVENCWKAEEWIWKCSKKLLFVAWLQQLFCCKKKSEKWEMRVIELIMSKSVDEIHFRALKSRVEAFVFLTNSTTRHHRHETKAAEAAEREEHREKLCSPSCAIERWI